MYTGGCEAREVDKELSDPYEKGLLFPFAIYDKAGRIEKFIDGRRDFFPHGITCTNEAEWLFIFRDTETHIRVCSEHLLQIIISSLPRGGHDIRVYHSDNKTYSAHYIGVYSNENGSCTRHLERIIPISIDIAGNVSDRFIIDAAIDIQNELTKGDKYLNTVFCVNCSQGHYYDVLLSRIGFKVIVNAYYGEFISSIPALEPIACLKIYSEPSAKQSTKYDIEHAKTDSRIRVLIEPRKNIK